VNLHSTFFHGNAKKISHQCKTKSKIRALNSVIPATFSLCSLGWVQASHPHKTTCTSVEIHGVTTQKIVLLIVINGRTSNPITCCVLYSLDFSVGDRSLKILKWILASNFGMCSALNFIVDKILIRYYCVQLLERCHTSRGFISCFMLWFYIYLGDETYTSFIWILFVDNFQN
jgi:hypothetical protein